MVWLSRVPRWTEQQQQRRQSEQQELEFGLEPFHRIVVVSYRIVSFRRYPDTLSTGKQQPHSSWCGPGPLAVGTQLPMKLSITWL